MDVFIAVVVLILVVAVGGCLRVSSGLRAEVFLLKSWLERESKSVDQLGVESEGSAKMQGIFFDDLKRLNDELSLLKSTRAGDLSSLSAMFLKQIENGLRDAVKRGELVAILRGYVRVEDSLAALDAQANGDVAAMVRVLDESFGDGTQTRARSLSIIANDIAAAELRSRLVPVEGCARLKVGYYSCSSCNAQIADAAGVVNGDGLGDAACPACNQVGTMEAIEVM